MDLANWDLRNSPKFTKAVKYQFFKKITDIYKQSGPLQGDIYDPYTTENATIVFSNACIGGYVCIFEVLGGINISDQWRP